MNRVWTFIISKPLNQESLKELQLSGERFVSGWTAHDNQLSASFSILRQRIVVVKVDEDVNNASGCSIDKLIRFMKEAEAHFGIELLNRLLVAYQGNDAIEVAPASKIKELLASKEISENTLIYNTAIANEDELKSWEQPLKNTWLNKYLEKA